MRTYSTADTMISEPQQTEVSPFAVGGDDEGTTVKRPGGKIIRNYRKVIQAVTKSVNSFDLGRQIYG